MVLNKNVMGGDGLDESGSGKAQVVVSCEDVNMWEIS
jgi:hypothetical protein